MIKKIVTRILRPRLFWRSIDFNELSELYVSYMLRTFAVSLLMVFVPYYLYQHHYTFSLIFIVFGLFFVTRVLCDVLSGFVIARYGPKHTMVMSCCFQIISALVFITIPQHHWNPLVISMPWGAATSFFFIAFHVEFSKIKHTSHAGKELGYMEILGKIGAIAGPLVGGIAGTIVGPSSIFLLATLVLFGSLWPLFKTSEPIKTRQKILFRTFPVEKLQRDIIANIGLGVENTLCINLWPLYVSIFALSGAIYAQLGALSSSAVFASLITAYGIGKIIDAKHGRRVLRIAAFLNAGIYFIRPLVHSLLPAFAINVSNEAVTTAYRMPFTKGLYGAADDVPGYRILYFMTLESLSSLMKATAWFVLALLAEVVDMRSVIIIGFMIASFASLVIMTEKFKALTKSPIIASL
ncbi:MAG: hypothetical protein NVSMB46_05030 [Candidatus Saccharimonadales bacterium]